MTRPKDSAPIVFSHANGFPAGTYRLLFEAWRYARPDGAWLCPCCLQGVPEVRLGMAEEGEDGQIRLLVAGFVPRQGFAEMAQLLADNLSDHAAAAAAQSSRTLPVTTAVGNASAAVDTCLWLSDGCALGSWLSVLVRLVLGLLASEY